jgi:hypothetical protein
MIDFKEIPSDGEIWELFTRDFLRNHGFFIESQPDRGPDAGKDILVTEDLAGYINKYRFRWLVSCKHKATSKRSVSITDEQNITDRLSHFRADGFMGFYSTVPSSGLNSKLTGLKSAKAIKDFTIFDQKRIENILITKGYSHLLMRYFPNSYKTIKPLHLISDKYEPLKCRYCNKDILHALFESNYEAHLNAASIYDGDSKATHIQDIYCTCAGECDRFIEVRMEKRGYAVSWAIISDLVIPMAYISYFLNTMKSIRLGRDVYTDEAYEKLVNILRALSQKVLRYTTEQEKERYLDLLELPG